MQRAGLASAFRRGLLVLIVLGLLTAIEFAIPAVLDSGSLSPLVVIALVKAGLILYYFMHVYHLWRQEE